MCSSDLVRKLHERRRAHRTAGERELHLRQARREDESGSRGHEQRRERLGVVVETDVDLPLSVRSCAVARDHADEQRPDRPERGCEDAEPTPPSCVATEVRDGDHRQSDEEE